MTEVTIAHYIKSPPSFYMKNDLGGAALCDGDAATGLAAGRTLGLNLLDNVQTINDLAKDDVLAVEPRGDNGGDEELRAVGVGASIGHAEQEGLGVLALEVLVGELLAVDGLAASALCGDW